MLLSLLIGLQWLLVKNSILIYVDVELTDGAYRFAKEPIIGTFCMKLMETGQDLNHVLIFKLLNANWTLSYHKVIVNTAAIIIARTIAYYAWLILIFGFRSFWLIKVCWELVNDGSDSLSCFSIVILIKWRENIVVHIIEFSCSTHRLKLKHL